MFRVAKFREYQGHRRVMFEHNGESSREESAWTWECSCGQAETASTKDEAHREWMEHKNYIKNRFGG